MSPESHTRRTPLLARPRLLQQLHANVGSGLAVLQAPAGYGKSVLLAQFAAELDYAPCWVNLDESCRSPEVFAERFVRTLRAGGSAPAAPCANRSADLKAYAGIALHEAARATDNPLLLVLDNTHALAGAEDSLDFLAWLLAAGPEGTEVLLAGREPLDLPEVDQRLAAGEALLIGRDSLAFTQEEVAALVTRAPGAGSDALFEYAQGWPVATVAMIEGRVPPPSGPRLEIGAAWERYLVNELWRTVPSDIQRSLMALSVPPVIRDHIAERLIGLDQWQGLIEWLDDHDFLLEPRAAGGLRFNGLIRQFLATEYRRRHPRALTSSTLVVAQVIEDDGSPAEAIELAADLHQPGVLGPLLERHGGRLLYTGAFTLLTRAFDAIPGSALKANPLLSAIKARVFTHTGKPGPALDIVSQVLASESASLEARMHALLARQRAFRLMGRLADCAKVFDEMRAEKGAGAETLRAEAAYCEAELEGSAFNNYGHAEELLRSSMTLARASGARPVELLAQSTLGQFMAMRGDGPAAVTELTRAALGWRTFRGTANLGWVLNNLGMAHLVAGDFESAVVTLEEAVREGQMCQNVRNEAYAIASLGDAELSLGHFEQAKVRFEEAIRLCALEVPDETLASLSIAGLAAAMLGLGDLQQADYFAERAMLVADQAGNTHQQATCKLQAGQVCAAAGNHAEAMRLMREAINLFKGIDASSSLLVAHYRLAMCHFIAGKRAAAQDALSDVFALITQPWQVGALLPALRENPMFAQWAATRPTATHPAFRDFVEHRSREINESAGQPVITFPVVETESLGPVRITVDAKLVPDEAWASFRAKELFFLFLAHRDGLRKEEAVDLLYPELSPEKCNSAFHSNVYRIRHALYQDSVIKRDGAYVLNPEGTFRWDAEEFEAAFERAAKLAPGSEERARQYERALALYRGPFAEAFYGEWAESFRRREAQRSQEALSVLAGFYAGRAEFELAAGCMARLLESDRYNVEAAYQVAAYRAQAGQPAVALAMMDEYRRSYEEELGERLPSRFQELRLKIASGSPV